ncbi:Acg family FMN-binding oxidoreductase [Spirillospora sp. NPDC048911]|uniref:Acg family FMN-binding oxidoreductase n=1 Tax=Spirillospora sp. NPDC048911 TaxID=3364527 RepID=UPI00371B92C6
MKPDQGRDMSRLAAAARSAVEDATWAPSVHNTQPWLFSGRGDRITLRADADRRLGVADPAGREMLISCGAALFTLRVAVRRQGYEPEVVLLPDPDRPNLLADVRLRSGGLPASPENERVYDQIRRRRTHRGGFKPGEVSEPLLEALRREAQREGASLCLIEDPNAQAALAALTVAAEHMHRLIPAYRGELGRWAPAPGSRRREGVHETAYPQETARTEPDFAGRDFARGHGWGIDASILEWLEEPEVGVACVLTTKGDKPADWLRTGQALQRLLLRATLEGDVAAAFHTQALEVPELRELIRMHFCAGDLPQMLMRLGTGGAAFTSVRRPVDEVYTEKP